MTQMTASGMLLIAGITATRQIFSTRGCIASSDDWAKRAVSFDNLICSHQDCSRYCQTKCFQSLFVDHETEAGGLLEWEIGRARSS